MPPAARAYSRRRLVPCHGQGRHAESILDSRPIMTPFERWWRRHRQRTGSRPGPARPGATAAPRILVILYRQKFAAPGPSPSQLPSRFRAAGSQGREDHPHLSLGSFTAPRPGPGRRRVCRDEASQCGDLKKIRQQQLLLLLLRQNKGLRGKGRGMRH